MTPSWISKARRTRIRQEAGDRCGYRDFEPPDLGVSHAPQHSLVDREEPSLTADHPSDMTRSDILRIGHPYYSRFVSALDAKISRLSTNDVHNRRSSSPFINERRSEDSHKKMVDKKMGKQKMDLALIFLSNIFLFPLVAAEPRCVFHDR